LNAQARGAQGHGETLVAGEIAALRNISSVTMAAAAWNGAKPRLKNAYSVAL
jgi:hypothetical protein